MGLGKFTIQPFEPVGTGLPVDPETKSLEVSYCANIGAFIDDPFRKISGVVLFLHGAGGSADDYVNIDVHRPADWDTFFLNTPRGGNSWMLIDQGDTLDHHWVNSQVEDAINYVSSIVDQLAETYGGYDKVWISGFSQGAVLSSAVALRGTPQVLGGAFVIAGYPPRPLYTDDGGAKDMPTSWSSAEKANKANTKIFFYTGELDTVLPLSESFCRYSQVLGKYGIGDDNVRYWSVTGACHYGTADQPEGQCINRISPNGNEFVALWHAVQGQPDSVEGVVEVPPCAGQLGSGETKKP